MTCKLNLYGVITLANKETCTLRMNRVADTRVMLKFISLNLLRPIEFDEFCFDGLRDCYNPIVYRRLVIATRISTFF